MRKEGRLRLAASFAFQNVSYWPIVLKNTPAEAEGFVPAGCSDFESKTDVTCPVSGCPIGEYTPWLAI